MDINKYPAVFFQKPPLLLTISLLLKITKNKQLSYYNFTAIACRADGIYRLKRLEHIN